MIFTLKPSLRHLALIKVLTVLCENKAWLHMNTGCCTSMLTCTVDQDRLEEDIIDSVEKLLIPEPLKEKMLCFIKPICEQIFACITEFSRMFHINLRFQFIWTQHGTVDKKKTAELLIGNDSIDISRRYELACHYCLEAAILKLWQKLPEIVRNYYYIPPPGSMAYINNYSFVFFRAFNGNRNVGLLDSCNLEGELLSLYQSTFEHAAENGNRVAAGYFWGKLTSKQREESLDRIAKKLKSADVIFFLLAESDEQQQKKLLRSLSGYYFHCFLEWPWQSLFLEVVSLVPFPPPCYRTLLTSITYKVESGYTDCDYRNLYRELWQNASDDFKDGVLYDSEHFFDLLIEPFSIDDIYSIKMIFQDVTPLERKNFLFSYYGQLLCENFMHKLDLLNVIIRESKLSKEEMLYFKTKASGFYGMNSMGEQEEFFQLIDDYIQECDKRKHVEEDGESAVKKLCDCVETDK